MAKRDQSRNSFNSIIQDYSDSVCFGEIWSREGLDRKQRQMIVLAQLVALNKPVQLRNHLDGALNIGITPTEIRELMLQSAVYCGLPAAVEAFKVAEDALKARKLID